MKTLTFDVMLCGRFVCTLHYRYNPLFPLTEKELSDFVTGERPGERPALKGKPFSIKI